MHLEKIDDQAHRYAVRTKPKEEDRADTNLRTWQVQTFAPKLGEPRTSGFGARYVSKPLFSGYIFANFDPSRQLHEITYTRGVQNVVSFGGNPISIELISSGHRSMRMVSFAWTKNLSPETRLGLILARLKVL